ncbi:MAG: RNA recognition motif domain-containing protein [Methylococcaceae bacterium]
MSTKLYVGNLNYAVDNMDLERIFAPHCVVQSAKVILDRITGRSRGFGFVEMDSDRDAHAAILALHGKDVDGRNLTVNQARPHSGSNGGSSNPYRRSAAAVFSDRRY